MKKQIYLLFLLLFAGIVPNQLTAQVTLAEWNFDYEYSTSASNDSTYYTPTGTAYTASAAIGITDMKFGMYANATDGASSDYLMTTEADKLEIRTGYNNYTTRLSYTGPGISGDFTNPVNHTSYYQYSFPTTGYDNVSLTFSIAGHQNDADDFMEVVYSVDGGSTWTDAGGYNVLSGWWLYQEYEVGISARHKSNVLVRLIPSSLNTGTVYFYVDYMKIEGTEYDPDGTEVDESSTIIWDFEQGDAGQMASYSGSTGNYFSADDVTIGSNLSYSGAKNFREGGTGTTLDTFTGFTPGAKSNAVTANDFVQFNIRPKTSLTYAPSNITFDCGRYGTGGGRIDVAWVSANGVETTVATDIYPNRDNDDANFTHVSIDVSGLSLPASAGNCALKIYIYLLDPGKTVGIGNVIVDGNIEGVLANVATYTLTTDVSPAASGSVSTNPPGTEFDDGTELTLTAARNFGYAFSHWEDSEANVLSSDNPFTFNLTENTEITAVFNEINTYSLNLTVENGNDYMVSWLPAPTVVEGENMYEEGELVTLSAMENSILSFSDWSTGETATSIDVTMTSNQSVTANYTAVDYIVGWDFYETSSSDKTAAFYSSANNSDATFSEVLASDNATTSSYLDYTYETRGSYWYGKSCAIFWESEADAGTKYYRINFDATGFENIKVAAAMLRSYSAYTVQNVEYSLDGVNYILLGTYTLTDNNAWYEDSFTLPSECDNASMVYIRWKADLTSTFVASGNDGTSIAEIFVTADKGIATGISETPTALIDVRTEDKDIIVNNPDGNKGTITIANISGQIIYNKPIVSNRVRVSTQKSGMYIVTFVPKNEAKPIVLKTIIK